MQAIIIAGGKQYIVTKDQTLNIDLLGDAKTIEFEALMTIDGDKIEVGTPVVKGVKVKADVLGMVKGEKLEIMRFKAKKRSKVHTGHRQKYSEIKISSIG